MLKSPQDKYGIVFCFQNYSTDLEKKFGVTRTIYLNSERTDQFLKRNVFLTCSWRFLRSNILEQLDIKSEKNIGIKKSAGKVRKIILSKQINAF